MWSHKVSFESKRWKSSVLQDSKKRRKKEKEENTLIFGGKVVLLRNSRVELTMMASSYFAVPLVCLAFWTAKLTV